MNPKQQKIIKWSARIIALVIILFGLPFYFGYGNPLPFINPDYSIWKNIILMMNPLIFIGLALGWKYEKISGYLIIFALVAGLSIGITTKTGFSINMIIAIIPGILYLLTGYNKAKAK
ncbi:MAG: hypothetical protein Q8L21_01680 [Candidatus Komeilibacteria bacterium]|nr:hypothetical protein [Candidatus Komeilibacteria bacterium]